MFGMLSQLSENFIFIYLGLSLFTETQLVYKPIFICVTAVRPFSLSGKGSSTNAHCSSPSASHATAPSSPSRKPSTSSSRPEDSVPTSYRIRTR